MACHAALLSCKDKGVEPTPDILQKGLDGNLCRCTGEPAAYPMPMCRMCVNLPTACWWHCWDTWEWHCKQQRPSTKP